MPTPDPLHLPATIPGLLRRGSPVVVTEASCDGLVAVVPGATGLLFELPDEEGEAWVAIDHGNFDVREDDGPALTIIPVSCLALDLHDATGRAHAAWWLADRLLQARGGSPVGWSCAGLRPWWLLYAEGDCRSFGLPGSGADYEVPGLDGVAWWLDGFDAPLALARVVAHVAGVARG